MTISQHEQVFNDGTSYLNGVDFLTSIKGFINLQRFDQLFLKYSSICNVQQLWEFSLCGLLQKPRTDLVYFKVQKILKNCMYTVKGVQG